jgi:hypothetical protein
MQKMQKMQEDANEHLDIVRLMHYTSKKGESLTMATAKKAAPKKAAKKAPAKKAAPKKAAKKAPAKKAAKKAAAKKK